MCLLAWRDTYGSDDPAIDMYESGDDYSLGGVMVAKARETARGVEAFSKLNS